VDSVPRILDSKLQHVESKPRDLDSRLLHVDSKLQHVDSRLRAVESKLRNHAKMAEANATQGPQRRPCFASASRSAASTMALRVVFRSAANWRT